MAYCIRPIIRLNKNKKSFYKGFEKEFWSYKHFPKLDKLDFYLKNQLAFTYPCGNCINCLNMKRYHWVKKMELEKRNWNYTYFLTLTYNQDNLPYELNVKHLQNFIKYMRKDFKLRYFGVGEYGGRTKRPHYHLILFMDQELELEHLKNTKKGPLFKCELLEKKYWLNKGYIWIAHDLNNASFAYVASYSNKNFIKQKFNQDYKNFKKVVSDLILENNYLVGFELYNYIDKYLIPSLKKKKPEFIIFSKNPPLGSSYPKVNKSVPSTLLKWHNKQMDIHENIYSKELEKRIYEYEQFLKHNNIVDIIYNNNASLYKKMQKVKQIV